MLDVVRQYVDAALDALPKDKAMDLASGLLETVRAEVRKQVGALGLATREDVDEIKERLWKLETAAAARPPAAKATTARKPAARKPAARKPAAKRPAAKRPAKFAAMPDGGS